MGSREKLWPTILGLLSVVLVGFHLLGQEWIQDFKFLGIMLFFLGCSAWNKMRKGGLDSRRGSSQFALVAEELMARNKRGSSELKP